MAGPWERYQQQPGAAAPAAAPPPAPGQGEPPGGLATLGMAGANSLLFGFGDEAFSGLKSLLTGRPYGDVLKETRGTIEAGRAAHPFLATVGDIGGALPSLAVPGGVVGRMVGVGAREAPTVGRLMTNGMLAGALNAFGNGEGGFSNRLNGMPFGMLAGAVGGAAAKPLGNLAGAVVRRGSEWLGSRAVPPGIRALAGPFRADAPAPGSLAARGPEAMLADAGPNLTQKTAAIYTLPGEGRAAIRHRFTQRAANATQRMQDRFNTAFGGQRQNLPETIERWLDDRSAAADPLYERVRASPVPWTNAQEFAATPLGRIVTRTPAGRQAYREAQKLAANDGFPFTPDTIDMRAINYMKITLDDQATALRAAGKPGAARSIENLRDRLLVDADRIAPDYANARAAWAGPSAMRDAVEKGQSAFSRLLSPEQMAFEMRSLSSGERDAYVMGARQWIDQIMGTARNDAAAAIRELSQKGWNREKLGMLVGPQRAEQLLQGLETERVFQRTSNDVMENSRTAERLQGARPDNRVRAAFEAGGWRGAVRAMGMKILGQGADAALRESDDVLNAEVGRMLTATGAERDQIEGRLRNYVNWLNRSANAGARANSIGQRATTGVGVTQGQQPAREIYDRLNSR